MLPQIILTAIAALIIGGLFGNVSTNMTNPMSGAFQFYGMVFPAVVGLACGIIGVIFGAAWISLVCTTVTGAVVGGLAVTGARWMKGF